MSLPMQRSFHWLIRIVTMLVATVMAFVPIYCRVQAYIDDVGDFKCLHLLFCRPI